MDIGSALWFIILGGLLGHGVTVLFNRFTAAVSLRVDRSDENEGPYLFLEMRKGLNKISRWGYVTLRVDNDGFIPRK